MVNQRYITFSDKKAEQILLFQNLKKRVPESAPPLSKNEEERIKDILKNGESKILYKHSQIKKGANFVIPES